MKKFLPVLLMGMAFLALLPAAGQKEEQKTGPETIVFYMWEDPTYQNIIDAFNNSQSDVYVDAKLLPSGDYETKLTTLLAGGTYMDAYMQKRQTDMFAQAYNGYVEPLDDLIAEYNYDMNAIAGYKSHVSIDGVTYGIPFRGSAYYTYYNKKVFDASGVPYPDTYVKNGTWNWDKFIEVSRKIASHDGKTYGGIIYTWGSTNAIAAHQRGISFITKDGKIDIDDSVVRSMDIRKNLESDKSIIPLLDQKVTKEHYSQSFYNGNAGMLIIGEWFPGFMISGRDKDLLKGFTWNDWGITRLPCDESTYRSFGAATFNHVHSQSKHKDAAFKFISWMGGPEGAKIMAENGFLPPMVTPDVMESLKKSIPDQESLKYFVEDKTVITPWYTKYGTQVESLFANTLEEYLANVITKSEIMPAMTTGLQDIVDSTD